VDYSPRWDYTSSHDRGASTTTVIDKLTGKVVGKPYRGKPDVRFDEGAGGIVLYEGTHPGA
jgi:hypothetical protein